MEQGVQVRCGVLAREGLPASVGAWLADLASVVPATDLDRLRADLEAGVLDVAIVAPAAAPGFGPAWVEKLRALDTRPEVVVLSDREDAHERSALLAAGCLGVLYLGLESSAIEAALRGLLRRVAADAPPTAVPAPPDARYRLSDYVTKSQPMRRFLAIAQRVARTDATALLLGETGVGKGLLARAIHNESRRRDGPFIAVNCGALVDTLLESELFGHERGAFTGAHRARRGHFELASGGTLFLDELTDLPLHLQSRLLTVIEERVVRPVGSERVRPADARVIAATNRDLEGEVSAGRFRADLFYRLNVLSLALPPLRERRADIPELIHSYAAYFAGRFDSPVRQVDPDVLAALERYAWPGNLRELRNVMERAVLLATGDTLTVSDLDPQVLGAGAALPSSAADPASGGDWLELPWKDARELALLQAEQRYLVHLLRTTEGRIGQAAARAGLDPRSLYDKLRRHGIRKEDFRTRAASGGRAPNRASHG